MREGESIASAGRSSTPTRHRALIETLLSPEAGVLVVGSDSGGRAEHLSQAGFRARSTTAQRSSEDEGLFVSDAAEAPAGRPSVPRLETIRVEFDCISVSGSLEYVPDTDLLEILYHLRRLLSRSAILILSLPDPEQVLELDSVGRRRAPEQYRFFLSRLGLDVVHEERTPAEPATGEAGEVTLVFRAAGGEGLRPIETLESILVEDRKVNSYKYALLRALANLAIHRYNAVNWLPDGRVALPWRLIADEWIAYYWPIVEADVEGDGAGLHPPEAPRILQGQRIKGKSDFAFRAGLTELAGRFATAGGYAAFSRSRDSGSLTADADALYRRTMGKLKAAIGQPVQYAGNERTTKGLFEFKGDYVILPGALWSELSVMGRWVIDSIVLRWADFTLRLRHQTPGLTREAALALILPADDADRDVAVAQAAFGTRRAQSSDGRIECVWSGERVRSFDVDHAIPFSLWGNNDLWNLLPASPAVNNAKRAKLPERTLIERRRDAILGAWEVLYDSERALFLAHAGNFTGHDLQDFGRRDQDDLFSTFKDAVEYTARNRVAERWAG